MVPDGAFSSPPQAAEEDTFVFTLGEILPTLQKPRSNPDTEKQHPGQLVMIYRNNHVGLKKHMYINYVSSCD